MKVRDPGLQAQRTALAWVRTGLAVLVNALVALRAGQQGGSVLATLLGLFLLAAAAATIACGAWRRRMLAAAELPGAAPASMIWFIVAITWIACVAGVAAILQAGPAAAITG